MTSVRTITTVMFSESLLAAMLDALSARPAAALLTTPTLVLSTAGAPGSGRDDSPAWIVPPVFTGYAGAALTLSSPGNVQDGGKQVNATALFGATADPTDAQECVSWAVVDDPTTPTVVYAAGDFDEPITITRSGDDAIVNLILPIASAQEF